MSALAEPKIDCHCHILDPQRYPYASDVKYKPAGQEIGTEVQFNALCDAYAVEHALLVGPNSGYGEDNRCLLDVIARGKGRFKGIAVVHNDASAEELAELKTQGIVGIAINATYHGTAYYKNLQPLIRRLIELDMFLNIQVEGDQLIDLAPLIENSDVKMLIDHSGRPIPERGLSQPGFKLLCAFGRNERAVIKLSGLAKFSRTAFPYDDTWPYVQTLADSFGPGRCIWGSDWPFLRAPDRLDYGVLLSLVDKLFPNAQQRGKLLWDNPRRLFGFAKRSLAT
ncbi:MAG TPA: amidohydrolase family protein [Reyranella sp.]|jgi:predicted TIM-barrel fold metal-dependent hydrolase|nr:amidohydrolase family protein [Reyranella sp.]